MSVFRELRPLNDPATGLPFPHVPCQDNPEPWDEPEGHDTKKSLAAQARAASVCRELCPALVQCQARARELGSRARGVWGGVIMSRLSAEQEKAVDSTVYDPELTRWAAAAGVTVRSPDGRTAAR